MLFSDKFQIGDFALNHQLFVKPSLINLHLLAFFFMMRCIQFIQTYSGNLSTSFNSSELLAVQALCHQLGSQNALLVQIAWLQISSFAQYSGHEFRWTSLLWI